MAKKKPAKKKAPKETKQPRADKWKNPKLLTDGGAAAPIAKVTAEVMLSEPEAQKLQDTIHDKLKAAESNIIEAAVAVDAFVRGEGWKALGYKGLTEWRQAEMQFSTFYNARDAMKLLAAGVPAERIEKMPLTNIKTLTHQLPESKWLDEKILDAAAGPVAAFEKRAKKQSEEMGQHVEEEVPRGFKIPLSLAKNWDKAMKIAGMIDGCQTYEQKIEAVVAMYLNSPSEVADKTRLELFTENYGTDE